MIIRNFFIDMLRGLAVFCMLIFHIIVDLDIFNVYHINYTNFFWETFRIFTVISFVSISGYTIGSKLNKNFLKQGIKLFCASLLVTLFTYFFDSSTYVRFGILHLLSFMMFFSFFLVRMTDYQILLVGVLILILSRYLFYADYENFFLLALGFRPINFTSIDYYPLVPWSAFFIIGVFIGRFTKLDLYIIKNPFTNSLAFLGENALVIYLLHQPIFVFLIVLFKKIFMLPNF